jgi:hypothetical protein
MTRAVLTVQTDAWRRFTDTLRQPFTPTLGS